MGNRTSIVIAHRLTTVEKCSRVVVLEHGKIAEDGTYSDLRFREEGYFSKISKQMIKQEKKEKKNL